MNLENNHHTLATHKKRIESLSRLIKKVEKAKDLASHAKALAALQGELNAFNLHALKSEVEAELVRIDGERQSGLASRREAVLHTARDRGMQVSRLEREDQIGPFRIRYSGDKVRCHFSGELVFEAIEFDAAKIIDRIASEETKLKEGATDRITFMALLRKGTAFAKTDEPSLAQDGGVPTAMLHLHVALASARAAKSFQKAPSKSAFPDYSRLDFLRDLSAFIDGGVSEAGWKVRIPTPALAQSNETIFLPSLSHPNRPPTAVHSIRVERETN